MRSFQPSELLSVLFGGLLLVWVFQTTYYQSQYHRIGDIHRHLLDPQRRSLLAGQTLSKQRSGGSAAAAAPGGTRKTVKKSGSSNSSKSSSSSSSRKSSNTSSYKSSSSSSSSSPRYATDSTPQPLPRKDKGDGEGKTKTKTKTKGAAAAAAAPPPATSQSQSNANTNATATIAANMGTTNSNLNSSLLPLSQNEQEAWCEHAANVCIEVLRELIREFGETFHGRGQATSDSTALSRISKIDKACFYTKDMQQGEQPIEPGEGTPLEWAIGTGSDVAIGKMFEDGWQIKKSTNARQIKRLMETSTAHSDFELGKRKETILRIVGSNNDDDASDSGSEFWTRFAEDDDDWFNSTKPSQTAIYKDWIVNDLGGKRGGGGGGGSKGSKSQKSGRNETSTAEEEEEEKEKEEKEKEEEEESESEIREESGKAITRQRRQQCDIAFGNWRQSNQGCYDALCVSICPETK